MADNGDKQTATERTKSEQGEADLTAAEQIARLYEQAESAAAQASERVVGSGGFAALLGQMAENTAALAKLSGDALDLTIRNLRLAGRRDIIRLARQLGRTEDKLERLLQEVEALGDRLPDPTTSASGDRTSASNSRPASARTPRVSGAGRKPPTKRA